MALTKLNPDQVFAFRWKEIIQDINEGQFDLEVLKTLLTEQEYRLLIDIAKRL
jgi:hypothetical protein